MKSSDFIGREAEMARLKGLHDKRCANLIVIRGRRRIGKSRLLAEFGKEMKSFFFSGNPPDKKTTAQRQRDDFSRQLEKAGIPGVKADDWSNLFWYLSKETIKGRVLIVFDEISWMGGKDSSFLGHLKTAWDLYFSKNPHLIMALCGSVSPWIEKNILSHTGFVGRIALDLKLEELPLEACSAFWGRKEERISPYEKFKILSITGGIPYYLEQIKPNLPAEKNIQELCFSSGGLLVKEFDEIFSDLFSRAKGTHKEIISCLADGPKDLTQICQELGKEVGGAFSKHLDELIKAGFVRRDFAWELKSGKEGKLSRYRLSDNYLRFYLKYISTNRSKIDKNTFSSSLTQLSGWEGIMGLQFENLVVNHCKALWKVLGLSSDDIVMEGPFFQTSTHDRAGCQIDYLIQTRFGTLYLCEIKFSKNTIGSDIIGEVEEKRKNLKVPRNFSIRPVLIHVNGVAENVLDERYFDKIINFGDLL